MMYSTLRWPLCIFLACMLLGLAAPMESDPFRAAQEAEHMVSGSETASQGTEAAHETSAGVRAKGLQRLRGESSGATDPNSPTHFMRDEDPFEVELQGDWAALQSRKDITKRIWGIPILIDARNYPRQGEKEVIGSLLYDERKLKARLDIRSLYTVAINYANDWCVYFQEEYAYNKAGLVSMVEQQLKAIYEDWSIDSELKALAKDACERLRESKYTRFGLETAHQVTEMMDKTLSDPFSKAALRRPFFKKGPEFLRHLGKLEQRTQPPHPYSDNFFQTISNTWIRNLQSRASRDIREPVHDFEARACLEEIVSDPEIPEWIKGEAQRVIDHLKRLQEYLALPDSPLKPLPKEPAPVQSSQHDRLPEPPKPVDELTHPQTDVPSPISAWLLKPENLRTHSEADVEFYIERNSKRGDLLASHLMTTITSLRNTADADHRAEIAQVINQHFNKSKPTAWLVFFSWVAHKAHKDQAFRASLKDLETPLFQIFKHHRDYDPVENFAQAVEELILEVGMPKTIARVPRPHESYPHQAMPHSPTPQPLDPTSPLARRLQHQKMLESPQPRASPPRLEHQTPHEPPVQQLGPFPPRFPSASSLVQLAKERGPVRIDPKSDEKAPWPSTALPPLHTQSYAFPLPPPPTAVKAVSSGKGAALSESSMGDILTSSQGPQPQASRLLVKQRQTRVPPPLLLGKRPGDPLEGPSLSSGESTPAVQADMTSRRLPHSPLSAPGSVQQGFTGAGIEAHVIPLSPGTVRASGETPLETRKITDPEQAQQIEQGGQAVTPGSKRPAPEIPTDPKSETKRGKKE